MRMQSMALPVLAALLLFGALLADGAASAPSDAVELRAAPRAGDGQLHVQLDPTGKAAKLLSPALAWRLTISGRDGLPYREGYVFSIRPAAAPAVELPCGSGEICPAGYSAASTSRDVQWEPLERADGTGMARAAVTVTLPLDLAWVSFLRPLETAAAEACRAGLAAKAVGQPANLARLRLNPPLAFPLKAAVFVGPQVAETELAIALHCWGSGVTAAEIAAAVTGLR